MPARDHDHHPSRRPAGRHDHESGGGRHELGQNFLVDGRVAAHMVSILRHAPPLPVVEYGAGDGAITRPLLTLGVPVTAVDIDPRRVADLRRILAAATGPGGRLTVVGGDVLTFDPPGGVHNLISNVPFGITTPLLRRTLAQTRWSTAVLLLQWEVARKRAAVGGTTLLTAIWWPWYEFVLDRRVHATAFRPVPAVDGGVLVIRRRTEPLVDPADRADYQTLVSTVFTSRGRGLGQILRPLLSPRDLRGWFATTGLHPGRLPRDVTAGQWARLWDLAGGGPRPRGQRA